MKPEVVVIAIILILIILWVLLWQSKPTVECETDANCSGDDVCVSGKCVAPGCPGCSFQELPVTFDVDTVNQSDFGSMAYQSNGKVVFGSFAENQVGQWDPVTGERSASFGTNTPATGVTEVVGEMQAGDRVQVDKDDCLYVSSYDSLITAPRVTKLLPGGQVDTTWGTSGTYGVNSVTAGTSQSGVGFLNPNTKEYYGLNKAGWVYKLDATGAVDTAFGTAGYTDVLQALDTMNGLNALDLIGNRLFATAASGTTIYAVCINATNGTLDTTWGVDGVYSILRNGTTFCGAYDPLCDVGPDGSLYIRMDAGPTGGINEGGCSFYQPVIIKLTPDGLIDTAFGVDGIFAQSDLGPGTTTFYDYVPRGRMIFDCEGNTITVWNGEPNVQGRDGIGVVSVVSPTGQLMKTFLIPGSIYFYPYGPGALPGKLIVGGSDYGVDYAYVYECANITYTQATRPW